MDYHVHSTFSDGFHSIPEMVNAAIGNNVQELCFTDHFSSFKPSLDVTILGEYIEGITTIKKQFSSQIKVHHGIEIDMSSNEFFDKLMNYSWQLILFEYVFSAPAWENNFTIVCQLKKEYPSLKIGLAHPSMMRLSLEKLNLALEAIRSLQIIIEANASYENYREPWFANLDDGFTFTVGSDAHESQSIGKVQKALDFFRNQNIPENCIIRL